MIMCGVYPANDQPNKYQIEMMYQIGLQFVPGFFRPEDEKNLGFKMSEYERDKRSVRLGASLQKLRSATNDLWDRLGNAGQQAFQWTYANGAIRYLMEIMANLSQSGIDEEKLNELDIQLDSFRTALMKLLKDFEAATSEPLV